MEVAGPGTLNGRRTRRSLDFLMSATSVSIKDLSKIAVFLMASTTWSIAVPRTNSRLNPQLITNFPKMPLGVIGRLARQSARVPLCAKSGREGSRLVVFVGNEFQSYCRSVYG